LTGHRSKSRKSIGDGQKKGADRIGPPLMGYVGST
jgi:hypothetical protein